MFKILFFDTYLIIYKNLSLPNSLASKINKSLDKEILYGSSLVGPQRDDFSFRIDNNIITFQGHPEYVTDYERHLINNFADNEPDDTKAAALSSMAQNNHNGKEVADMLVKWIDQ